MASVQKKVRSSWTQEMEENLIELWQERPCLFDVSSELYHNRLEKEKSWREIANSLQQPVEEVKTRALSLRTQFSKLIKPKPSGSGNKPLTPRQKWLLRIMDFIKKHIIHRPSETTLDLPPNDQDNTEDQDYCDVVTIDESTESLSDLQTPLSTPRTPTPTSRTSSPVECVDSPTTASTDAVESCSVTLGIKRRARSVPDIELQKLAVLKKMVAKVESDPTPDAFSTFGNQVASEIRLIQDAAIVTRLKRNIMNMIYDAQDSERSRSSSQSPSAQYTFHSIPPLPPVQSYPPQMPPQVPRPQSFLQTLPPYDVNEPY